MLFLSIHNFPKYLLTVKKTSSWLHPEGQGKFWWKETCKAESGGYGSSECASTEYGPGIELADGGSFPDFIYCFIASEWKSLSVKLEPGTYRFASQTTVNSVRQESVSEGRIECTTGDGPSVDMGIGTSTHVSISSFDIPSEPFMHSCWSGSTIFSSTVLKDASGKILSFDRTELTAFKL